MTDWKLKLSERSTLISPPSNVFLRLFIIAGAIGALLLVPLFAKFFLATRSTNVRAFRVPSDSMCPAICANERIFVAMDAYYARPPARGDVILFRHQPSNNLFLKRVIAIGGDTVAPGPRDTILVNGKPVEWPAVCGHPVLAKTDSEQPLDFAMVTVPAGTFFVVGDSLDDSFDSRIGGFGPITLNQIMGKPAMIYWSPGSGRIGCSVR